MTEFNAKNRIRMFTAALVLVLAVYACAAFTYFEAASDSVRNGVVRMHILANSDSEADQQVKLCVRDALLEMSAQNCKDSISGQEAAEYFENEAADITELAESVLKENGFTYGASTKLCREYFTTRRYGNLTFPAGIYTSVKVELGEGKGHNWWCVMFPPLCVPAAEKVTADGEGFDLLTDSGEKIITNGEKYAVRFKIVEWYEWLRDNLL